MIHPTLRRALLAPLALAAALAAAAEPAAAQWVRTHEQFYLPAPHNWVFRRDYPQADRLFNAFDYGHAVLYEELWRRPQGPAARLEEREYAFITRRLLNNPPRVPLEETAIEVGYARLVPEARLMFEWAHLLHRQLYDVLADERLDQAQKDAAIADLIAYYRTRPDLAFSSRPKSMELMEGQFYATAFREGYPKFNGLIWAYHWLQVGLYEPLLMGRNGEERQTGVTAAVTRFRQMLESPPENMPRVMPMTAAVAPAFTARYPEAAIIFDNLHGMHDVISDILASPRVPRERKREEILRAAARYRDDTSFVMTEEEWRAMAVQMGVQNMGGPATGFMAGFPPPTVERGAVMAHAAGAHSGHGAAPPAPPAAPSEHAGHAAAPAAPAADKGVQPTPDAHAGHGGAESDSADVAHVVHAFHEALAQGDSAAALALLTDDVQILESGGMEDRAEYRSHHLGADIEFARAVPSHRAGTSVRVVGDVAWAVSTSTTHGTFRGRDINSAGAELMVLLRTPQGWRIAAIHWSSRNRRS